MYYTPQPHSKGGDPHLGGRTLTILKILLINGYYIFSEQGDNDLYHTLRKHFPNIHKVRACRKTIIFLEEKSNEAIRGLLESINKRKISYWELEKISKAFKSKLTTKEKEKYRNKT